MYSKNPSFGIRRRLNRHASTIILGGIFLFFSLSFFMAMCKMPCETINIEQRLLNKMGELHEGHKPRSRNYDSIVHLQKSHLVILILTAPNQKERRDAIRNTWFSPHYPNVTIYFSVGTYGLNTSDARNIHNESSVHGDLLLLQNFKESYRGLTSKLLESFKWLHENVDFHYVIKADDDSFIRIDRILAELISKPLEKFYWGFFDGRANVKKSGQWAEKNWILCDKYGPHARGGGYLLSSDLVSYIVINSHMLQKYSSEDISVGTWLGPLNIYRMHDPRFDTEYMSRGCNNEYIITHKQSPSDMAEKWKNLKTKGHLCIKEVQLKLSYIYNWKVPPSECCVRNNTKCLKVLNITRIVKCTCSYYTEEYGIT